MFTNTTRVLSCSLIFAAAASAQTPQSFDDYGYRKALGDSRYAEGILDFDAHVESGRLSGVSRAPGAWRDPQTIGAEATIDGDAKLFGRTIHVFDFEARARSRDAFQHSVRRLVAETTYVTVNYWFGPVRMPQVRWVWRTVTETVPADRGARMNVELFGLTVEEREASTTLSHSMPIYFPPLIGASRTFTVGPVPVQVEASAGVSGEVSATLSIDPNGNGATASAPMSAWINARASAGIGGSVAGIGAHAGVYGDMQLMRLTMTPSVSANRHSGFRGDLTLTLRALALELGLYATIEYLVGSHTWTLPVFETETREQRLASVRMF